MLAAALGAPLAAQPLTFTTLAGPAGGPGPQDGIGNAARFFLLGDVATDGADNVYVADTYNHTIRKITPAGVVTTLAGLAGVSGSANGTGSAARFYAPSGIAVTNGGTVYVADELNFLIRKITSTGVVTALAGFTGSAGSSDGMGSAARFNRPCGVAVGADGSVYVADRENHTIRKITPAGLVSTLAGLAGNQGSADGTGSAARFRQPTDVAVDSGANVFVVDSSNHTIRKITPAGVVTTFAGLAGSAGSANGIGNVARFNNPMGLTTDASDIIYVADSNNNTIRRITTGAEVTTFAGLDGVLSPVGDADGTGSAARFNGPTGTAADSAGNVYVADKQNHTIRKITPGAAVTTFAGSPATPGKVDGTGSAARFSRPSGVAADGDGIVYVADDLANMIRKITSAGVVITLAGSPLGGGSIDGTGSGARFFGPAGVAVDSGGTVYVADSKNHTIRKITPAGVVTTFAGLAGSQGSDDGTGTAARFRYPQGIAVDGGGTVYVADTDNHTIRRITPLGVVDTFAGLALAFGSADGTGSTARFYYPIGIAVDGGGTIYVADRHNDAIRMVTAAGDVTTLAGLPGSLGSADGTGSAARFHHPTSVAADNLSNLWVADRENYTIRKIAPGAVVTTVGGLFAMSGSADGEGSDARFYLPTGVGTGPGGKLFVADDRNNKIRVGQIGLAGAAFIDSPVGGVGAPRQLDTTTTAPANFQWSVIRRPGDTNVTVSDETSPNPTFTPDVPDLYEFELVASDGVLTSISSVSLLVPVVVVASSGTTVAAEACSAANNAIDPGESVTVNFSLQNLGNTNAASLLVALQGTGGVIDPSGPQNYGALVAGGAAVSRPFAFTVDPAAVCSGTLTATFDVWDGFTSLGTVAVLLAVGTPGQRFSTGAISVVVPDLGSVEIPLTVAAAGLLADIDASLRLNHTNDGDLDIALIGPTGTTVDLSSGNGGTGDNYGAGATNCNGTATVFDDEAATTVLGAAVPFAGTFRPESQLSAFDGNAPSGTWRLRLTDNGAGQTGTAFCFGLDIAIAGGVCCAACGPSAARGLQLTGEGTTTLAWSSPAVTGGSPVVYDALRATVPTAAGFASATCLVSDSSAGSITDSTNPPSGEVYFYLVRAENACGSHMGNDSNGTPRTGRVCP